MLAASPLKVIRMIVVFYDDLCHVCRREINLYQRFAPNAPIEWRPLSQDRAVIQAMGITHTEALMTLHAQDAQGQWHLGVDAFVLIWQQFKYGAWFAACLRAPIIYPCLKWGYQRFAKRRFERLSHCQLAQQQEQEQKQKNTDK